jgi:hypothetical protein
MALRKDIEMLPHGFQTAAVLKDAYCKVETIGGGKTALDVTVVAYNRHEGADTPAKAFSYRFTPATGSGVKDFIAQAYDFIKSQPEFADAQDC